MFGRKDEETPVDRAHTAAVFMGSLLAKSNFEHKVGSIDQNLARIAIEYADSLVKELQKDDAKKG